MDDVYKKIGRGDVSPVEMKIIMYEGNRKFAMRGHQKIKVSATDYMGGEYKFDNAFIYGPKEFKIFAQKIWRENLLEKFSKRYQL